MAIIPSGPVLEFLQSLGNPRTVHVDSSELLRPTEQELQEATNPTPVSVESRAEELTEEEANELIQRAMANLGLQDRYFVQVDTSQEEPQEEEEIVGEEVAVNPYENIPVNERPVEVPDYTNVREETQRFSDAEWFGKAQEQTVILAGIGGIGSNLAIILAKLNPRSIYLFDRDEVEAVNLAGQFYANDDVGMSKVNALARTITRYTNYSSVVALERNYTPGENIVGDIMICGFDSMRSRKTFFNAWRDRVNTLSAEQKKNCLYMDGRLTATEFQIFCMTGEDTYYMREYANNWLFDDWQALDLPCSFKQTGYLAQMIGAYMVNLFVNFCANRVNPVRNAALPFITSYKGDMMYLELRR